MSNPTTVETTENNPPPEADVKNTAFDQAIDEKTVKVLAANYLSDQENDFEKLNETLNIELIPKPIFPAPKYVAEQIPEPSLPISDSLEELADDMLHLMRQVQGIEQRLADSTTRLERIEQSVNQSNIYFGQQLDKFRREIIGERKALSSLSILNAVLPTLDSLKSAFLTKSTETANMADNSLILSIIDSLNRMLRNLGFTEFMAIHGDPFDPDYMECLGYSDGNSGIVLDIVRPGYKVENTIVRPVGVILADPLRKDNSSEDLRAKS